MKNALLLILTAACFGSAGEMKELVDVVLFMGDGRGSDTSGGIAVVGFSCD